MSALPITKALMESEAREAALRAELRSLRAAVHQWAKYSTATDAVAAKLFDLVPSDGSWTTG